MVLVDAKVSKQCPKQAKYHDTQQELIFSFEMYHFGHCFETFASTKTTLSLAGWTSYSKNWELLEENSTASSWNMKSIRQRKVLA